VETLDVAEAVLEAEELVDDVLVALLNVKEVEFEAVKVAELKVLFLFIAVPVPAADAAEVMAMVLLLYMAVVEAATAALAEEV